MIRILKIGIMMLVLAAASCLARKPGEPSVSPRVMAERIVSEHGGSLPISVLTPEDGDFARFVVDYYQLDSAEVLDGAICYADGAEAFEVAVLAFSDEAAAKKSTHALSSYKDSRAQVFDGYAPAQAALVRDGIVDGCGRYVALLICPSAQDARTLFRNCFLPEPGGNSAHAQQTVSGYDEKAVLAAWKSGDRSSLDSKNRRILDGAADAISRIVRDDMSDAEKERAVHDWMTDWATFDSSVFGRNAEIRKDSDTPFGFFVEKRAMCHGYSSTFQLFMDMLGIECLTVFGLPGGNGMRHSWNQVRLDGEWYCVDVAWDDPIGGRPTHQFLNVTSRILRNSGIHRWDESSVPEACGTKHAAR